MKKVGLIVSGGKGLRMNSNIPKQFLLLKGTPVLMHTLEKFSHLDKIILVLPKYQIPFWEKLCSTHNFNLPHIITEGGKTRFVSVKNGLKKINDNSLVAIHDGVRPFISKKLIIHLISKVRKGIGVIPIIPLKDSIRKIVGEDSISVDRNNFCKVQTPQCFLSNEIKEAYKQDFFENFTDDASVFERYGGNNKTVLGEEKNFKITTEEDLKIASALCD